MNVVMEGASLTDSGKLFHAVGPATMNALLLSSRQFRGTKRSPHVAERNRDRYCVVLLRLKEIDCGWAGALVENDTRRARYKQYTYGLRKCPQTCIHYTKMEYMG